VYCGPPTIVPLVTSGVVERRSARERGGKRRRKRERKKEREREVKWL
jgi:hypothetical protein